MEQGMVIVNAEDWRTITSISAQMGLFIAKSGHINNGRKNDHARKKLRGYARPLLQAQQRFVHPVRGPERMVALVSEAQQRLEIQLVKK
jgi:hypothetical protein